MTHEEIAAAVADVIQEHVALALAPVLTRLAVAESQVAQFTVHTSALGELRDRVVVVETKSAVPVVIPAASEPVDLSPVLERLAVAETRLSALTAHEDAMGELRDRVVVVETKAAVPVVAPPVVHESSVDLSPVLERLASAEARLDTLGDLRDRVVVVETKAAVPPTVVESVSPVDFSPVLERIAAAEARLSVLGDLRDRVVTVETKAAIPTPVIPQVEPPIVDLSPVLERLAVTEVRLAEVDKYAARIEGYTSFLQRDTAALSERVAVIETRPQLPGPAGEPGAPGKDGKDGASGLAGLSYEGVYQEGKSYDIGNLVTWAGSSWHCNQVTMSKPGEGSKDWTLMVKRGRDGRDGRDAIDPMPVVSVGKR